MSKRIKKLVVIAVGLLFGMVIVPLLILWWTSPRINPDAFDKIQSGMTRSEVTAILNHTHHHAPREFTGIGHGASMSTMQMEAEGYVWLTHDCQIYVVFDESEKVAGKLLKTYSFDESFLERMCRWLRFS